MYMHVTQYLNPMIMKILILLDLLLNCVLPMVTTSLAMAHQVLAPGQGRAI